MKNLLLVFIITILSACGSADDTSTKSTDQELSGSFPALPTSQSELVVLEGAMTFWMYEGSAGCYGNISDGAQEVQLWAGSDACGDIEFAENAKAKVEVIFNQDEQFGPGETYTIVNFL